MALTMYLKTLLAYLFFRVIIGGILNMKLRERIHLALTYLEKNLKKTVLLCRQTTFNFILHNLKGVNFICFPNCFYHLADVQIHITTHAHTRIPSFSVCLFCFFFRIPCVKKCFALLITSAKSLFPQSGFPKETASARESALLQAKSLLC